MAFRQVARVTGKFSIFWSEWLEVTSVSEDDAPEIGDFLLRLGHPLRPECQPGTLDGPTYYVRRLFDCHRTNRNYPLALQCSPIVRQTESGQIVGVCLVGGGGDGGQEFGVYDIQVDPRCQTGRVDARLFHGGNETEDVALM